jgi:SAM-dependent methyltransferase
MGSVPAELADHPDRRRWNARYGEAESSFAAHPLAVRALGLPLPAGPVLELASGPSGAVLAAAATGRRVVAVDVSDVALEQLAAEAARRGLAGLITLEHADLGTWRPEPGRYALVLATGFWDPAVFGVATTAVSPGGVLAWEALTPAARRVRPGLNPAWLLSPGEPASRLPAGFAVLEQADAPAGAGQAPTRRRLIARRQAASVE